MRIILQDLLHDRGLVSSGYQKDHLLGVIEHRQCKGQARRFELLNIRSGDPPFLLVETGGAGKERGGMSIRSDPKKRQIKRGPSLLGPIKKTTERLFVLFGRGLKVAHLRRHSVDIAGWNGNMRDQRFMGHAVI